MNDRKVILDIFFEKRDLGQIRGVGWCRQKWHEVVLGVVQRAFLAVTSFTNGSEHTVQPFYNSSFILKLSLYAGLIKYISNPAGSWPVV